MLLESLCDWEIPYPMLKLQPKPTGEVFVLLKLNRCVGKTWNRLPRKMVQEQWFLMPNRKNTEIACKQLMQVDMLDEKERDTFLKEARVMRQQ